MFCKCIECEDRQYLEKLRKMPNPFPLPSMEGVDPRLMDGFIFGSPANSQVMLREAADAEGFGDILDAAISLGSAGPTPYDLECAKKIRSQMQPSTLEKISALCAKLNTGTDVWVCYREYITIIYAHLQRGNSTDKFAARTLMLLSTWTCAHHKHVMMRFGFGVARRLYEKPATRFVCANNAAQKFTTQFNLGFDWASKGNLADGFPPQAC